MFAVQMNYVFFNKEGHNFIKDNTNPTGPNIKSFYMSTYHLLLNVMSFPSKGMMLYLSLASRLLQPKIGAIKSSYGVNVARYT